MARKSVRVKKAQPNAPAGSETETLTGQEATAQQQSVATSGGGQFAATTDETSVTQYGITWYFDPANPRPVGQYCNGDYFVVGPVTITSITPESVVTQLGIPDRVINGTMVNPLGEVHGFDSWTNVTTYSEALNKAPNRAGNLAVTTGSVVSTISVGGTKSHANGTFINDLAILTVVASAPLAGAFRPHPYGADKASYWNEGSLNYSIFQSLTLVSGVPDYTEARRESLRAWFEPVAGLHKAGEFQAVNNQPGYGSNLAMRNGDFGLMLHLAIPADVKRDILVGIVQYGLDIYGRMLEGGLWGSDGGHALGRKLPLLLAGLALGDSNISFWANRDNTSESGLNEWPYLYGYNLFQEDGSTFVVNQAQINDGHGIYTQQHLGVPEWGVRYWQFYDSTTQVSSRPFPALSCESDWGAIYRYVGNQYVAHALAVRMTVGGVSAWNWQPFFDYADRHVATGYPSSYGPTVFAVAMWNTYRADYGPVWGV